MDPSGSETRKVWPLLMVRTGGPTVTSRAMVIVSSEGDLRGSKGLRYQRSTSPRGYVPAEEVAHEPGDQVSVAFQREVSGVEQVELQRLEVPLVRLGPGRREDLVVLAPGDENRGLV